MKKVKKVIVYSASFVLLAMTMVLLMSVKACVKTPELVSIDNLEFLTIRDSVSDVTVTCTVKNPNKIGATVERIDAVLFIDGKKLGKVDAETEIAMKGNENTTMTVPAALNLAALSSLFPSMMEKDSCLVEIKGKFFVKVGVAGFTIEAETGKKLPMRQELEKTVQSKLASGTFKVKSIRPKSISMSKSSLEMVLLFSNEMAIDYEVEKLNLKLFMPNQTASFGEWSLKEATLLSANSQKNLEATIEVDNASAFQQMLSNIFGKKVVVAKGIASVKLGGYPFEVPVSQEVGLGVF